MSDKILVLIPCYNCEPQIPRVLRQFDEHAANFFSEILVLDNGSKDNTVNAATEAARELKGLLVTIGRNRANYNLGGSHKAAFSYATENGFSHVVVLHGDDQGDVHDLLPILESGEHRTHDACLGARFMKGSRLLGYSTFRVFGNNVFNIIFTLMTGHGVKDLGSGLNLFGRKVFEDPRVFGYADDLRFNVYLMLGLFERKLNVKYFPISWREDDQISNVKMTSQALKTLSLLWQSISAPKNFWSADHRITKHLAYEFDTVYQSPK